MKFNTLEQVLKHMETNEIYFCDSGFAKISLTKGQIHGMMESEYGIRPKRKRTFNKKLKQLINELLRYALESHKEDNDEIKPLGIE